MRLIAAPFALLAMCLPALAATNMSLIESNVSQVAAGGRHTCAITGNGTVECWGANSDGQLGNGSTTGALAHVTVTGIGNAVAITAGDTHTCVVTTPGFARCWGYNGLGQLGNATTTSQSTSVAVIDLGGVAAMSAGYGHTCALLQWGVVRCWGYNAYGQLGDGTNTSRQTPVAVSGVSDAVAITAGAFHTCALSKAGAVTCWGLNTYGRLGDGSIMDRNTPVAVSGLDGGVAAIAAAGRHTCALMRAGTVKCWGYNDEGELGDGSTTTRTTPVAVSGLSGVASIAATTYHTCALRTAGTVVCWGQNGSGQLGDGGSANATAPVAVSGLADIAAISAGGSHSCAQSTLGGVKCWGYNAFGQIGDTTTANRALPRDVEGFSGSRLSAIATGSNHSCAVTAAGAALCWGTNSSGQLGDGTYTSMRSLPAGVSGLRDGVAVIAPSFNHSCALTTAGAVLCWGSQFYGQLGNGVVSGSPVFAPVAVSGLASGVARLAAAQGGSHTCVRTTAGAVKCWGANANGQLGDGSQVLRSTPVDVVGLGSGVSAIAVGSLHTCALSTAGAVTCWGHNDLGQLGDGTQTDRSTPVAVTGLGSGVAAIAAGGSHTCALTSAGAVKCWGSNSNGQMAGANLAYSTTPFASTGLGAGIAAIAAGGLHTCALTTGGAVKCWGANASGQVGDGSVTDRNVPVDAAALGSGMVSIATGYLHTCALSAAGTLFCWGDSTYDQLGYASTSTRVLQPQAVRPGRTLRFEPLARMGAGVTATPAALFVGADSGSVVLNAFTPDTCSVDGSSVLTFIQAGLCGVRAAQAVDATSRAATPPAQVRLIQIDADLVFANGVDVWGGAKH